MANAQIQVDFLENGRGGHFLLYEGYKFSIKTRRNDRCYWRCVLRDCAATITTLNNIPVTVRGFHNHPSNGVGLAAEAFINSVKKRCRDEINPIPSIYDEELGSLRNREFDDTVEDMIRQIPSFESCKALLYRSRSKVLPKLPKSQNEVDLDGVWKETCAGEQFLLCDDVNAQGHRILIFATESNLQKLCDSDIVFSDGTFYSCPGIFSQLYTIHGKVGDTVFPLVFALLPNKTEQTYIKLFGLLRDALAQINLVFMPQTFLMDFELATRNALNLVFPGVTVKACFFHFTQCIWRKTQECGLVVRYRENDNIRKLVRRAAVLPLVPIPDVEDVWFHALEENDDMSPEVTRFTDYVTVQWVESNQLDIWNHYANDGPRTNNNAEGYHSKLNKLCQHAHPNIYALVNLLKNIQSANEAKIIQVNAGAKQRPRKRKYRLLDSRLQRTKERFQNGQLSAIEYADAASHLLHLD